MWNIPNYFLEYFCCISVYMVLPGDFIEMIKNFMAALSMKSEFAARRDKLYRIAYSWCHNAALAERMGSIYVLENGKLARK